MRPFGILLTAALMAGVMALTVGCAEDGNVTITVRNNSGQSAGVLRNDAQVVSGLAAGGERDFRANEGDIIRLVWEGAGRTVDYRVPGGTTQVTIVMLQPGHIITAVSLMP